eukprot:TRINITY_DN19438_c0_g1_i1.p1 TRINITY_DN19438_c0_g1~~TRINITY_DN19438_c0_g1_i1.p1  ORF type:complete len:195 (-),score=19.92 TRINITY_DN19438_c0_g1_i1:59-643(-)
MEPKPEGASTPEPSSKPSMWGKPIVGYECRKFRASLSEIYNIIADCRYYSEWWPEKEFTGQVEVCKPGAVGTKIAFTSNHGDYGATITSAKKNDHLTFTYDRGIFGGSTVWSMSRAGNAPSDEDEDDVTVCFNSRLDPKTAKLKLYSNFVAKGEANSYFSPLFDSLQKELTKRKEAYRSHSPTSPSTDRTTTSG